MRWFGRNRNGTRLGAKLAGGMRASLHRGARALATGVAGMTALAGAPHATTAQEVDAAAIDAIFADIAAGMPGCAVGVYRAGEVAYRAGYGVANLDYDLPITPESVFYLGSVGKQFTAAAVLHAAEAGHLTLDDPVQKWITELRDYGTPVTVRHLIHHTSGIRDYLTLLGLAGIPFEVPLTDSDVVGLIAAQEGLNFAPGERYLYSNSGYFLLSQIVERATGDSLREYLETHFFGPLGMSSTRVHDDRRESIPNRVVGYQLAGDRARMDHPWSFDQVGSGGVYSSIDDMAQWDRNWFTEEVGGEGFSKRLSQRGVLNDGRELPYAFGLTMGNYRGQPSVEHGGALAAFRSHLLRFPALETTAMVACSFPTSDPGARARRVADAVLGDRLDAVVAEAPESSDASGAGDAAAASLSSEELDRFVGSWRASNGVQIAIERAGEGLVFVQNGQRAPVQILGEDHIGMAAVRVDMRLGDLRDGKYHHMDVTQGPQTFAAERVDPAGPTDWSLVVGRYYSRELDTTWTIETYDVDGGVGGARLVLQNGMRPLNPVGPDRFVAPGAQLEVEREGGRVVAFTVDAGRAQGMRFEREGS